MDPKSSFRASKFYSGAELGSTVVFGGKIIEHGTLVTLKIMVLHEENQSFHKITLFSAGCHITPKMKPKLILFGVKIAPKTLQKASQKHMLTK